MVTKPIFTVYISCPDEDAQTALLFAFSVWSFTVKCKDWELMNCHKEVNFAHVADFPMWARVVLRWVGVLAPVQ